MAHAPPRFLSLPGELRNRIYEPLLLYADTIGRSRAYIFPYGPRSSDDAPELSYNTRLHPQILSTCSTIAFEALPILYAKNGFALWATQTPYFMRMIGTRNASLLKILLLTLDGVDGVPEQQLELEQAFELCASLKCVNISVEFDLEEKTLDEHQQSVHDLLCKAQKWLAAHPSLTLAMSPYPTGQCRYFDPYTELDITFVATQEDYCNEWEIADDPVVLDLNAILYELGQQLRRPVQHRIYPIQGYHP
ncbi:MAG: hypothetical protein Q9208_002767 [Pyrenodesmia sp. 3 TL-2023]